MTLMREFLDALGLPTDGWADELPVDHAAQRRAKIIRLTKRIQKIRSAMIRRKQRIERLQREVGVEESADARICVRIQRHEAHYQALISFYAATQAKLTTARIT